MSTFLNCRISGKPPALHGQNQGCNLIWAALAYLRNLISAILGMSRNLKLTKNFPLSITIIYILFSQKRCSRWIKPCHCVIESIWARGRECMVWESFMVVIRDNTSAVLLITLFTISDEQVETCSWSYEVPEMWLSKRN